MPSWSLSAGGSADRCSGQFTTPWAVAKLIFSSRLGLPLRLGEAVDVRPLGQHGLIGAEVVADDVHGAAAGRAGERAVPPDEEHVVAQVEVFRRRSGGDERSRLPGEVAGGQVVVVGA